MTSSKFVLISSYITMCYVLYIGIDCSYVHLSNVSYNHLQCLSIHYTSLSINSFIEYNFIICLYSSLLYPDNWHTLLYDPFILSYFSLGYCSGLFNQSTNQWTCDIIRTFLLGSHLIYLLLLLIVLVIILEDK